MADIRSSQNIAQVEWDDPPVFIVSQNIAQVEYDDAPAGWTGKINRITNPAKINGVTVADITSVMGQ